MDILTTGRPIESLLSLITEIHTTPQLEQLQAWLPFPVGDYQGVVEKSFFEKEPYVAAFAFALSTSIASALQAFSWGTFCCFKVSTLAGACAGGILGGACGIFKASQQRLGGEDCQPFTKTIRDYAICGIAVGLVCSFFVSLVPVIWVGVKVTILAAPVLTISVPLFAALGALSGVEFAYRGNRSIGYRAIDKVFEYTMPFKYFSGLEEDIPMAQREQKVPLYPNLETRDVPPELQHPLPRRAVLVASSAELHENGITE